MVVERGRSIVVVVLVAIWFSAPALACLPNPQMTQAEMACCKKMAGDCNMGGGKHPCCKVVAPVPSPIASSQSKAQLQPVFVFVALVLQFEFQAQTEAGVSLTPIGLPPPAPPGPNSTLRI